MKTSSNRSISWRSTLPFWLCISAITALFSLSEAGHWIERTLAGEWIYTFRGARSAPSGVVVVSMDKKAGDLPAITRSDRLWSRTLYASLIDQLSAAGAALIVLDVTFEDVGDEDSDIALEQSLAHSNRVILFQRLHRTEAGDVTIKPLARFASAARTLAVLPLPKHARVDVYWPFFPTREPLTNKGHYADLPSLPVAALQTQLYDQLGASVFEQLLNSSENSDSSAKGSTSDEHVNVTSLLTSLRTEFISGRIPESDVDRLVSGTYTTELPVETMLNSLKIAYTARSFLPLNFYGPPRTIETLDHMMVTSNTEEEFRVLEKAVSGRVVFIGHSPRSAVDQLDGIPTVYTRNGLDLSGVEIAATAYANLKDGSVPKPVSTFLNIGIFLILGVMSAYFAFHPNIIKAVALNAALALMYFFGCIGLFTGFYTVLPLAVPVLILLPVTLFSTLVYRYISAHRQFGVYRHGMQQFLPQRATIDIENGVVEPANSESLYGTCMITDIEDFTHYAEKLGHQHVSTLSHEYFSLAIEQVVDAGGELFDVYGDGITAFWGRSESTMTSGQRAMEAAVNITNKINRFNEHHPESPFITRIGLECGWIEARYLGTQGNYRYCLVGDVANTSSRLEGLNKRLGTTVLASRNVIADSDFLLTRPVGSFILKGKSNITEVFEIVAFQDSSSVDERAQCTHFSESLRLISQGQWDAAKVELLNHSKRYTTDGVAHFYLELLEGGRSSDVHLDRHGVVHVHGK